LTYVQQAVTFPNLDPAVGLVASFATFSVGFVARKLGGLFFGTIGDKLDDVRVGELVPR
jgi:hypothetical protein